MLSIVPALTVAVVAAAACALVGYRAANEGRSYSVADTARIAVATGAAALLVTWLVFGESFEQSILKALAFVVIAIVAPAVGNALARARKAT